MKSSILIPQESLVQKNPKVVIASQSTIEDLSFPQKILKMNSCTFVLQRKILYFPLDVWHLCRRLRANNVMQTPIVKPYVAISAEVGLLIGK